MVNYTTLAQDRLATSMGDYHMITAVTQRAVNAQLRKLWQDPRNGLDNLNIQGATKTVMSSSMGPPRVQFQLGTRNLRVVFFLEFKSGGFNYFNMNTLASEWVVLDGCTLAFDVDMSMEVLTNPKASSTLVTALRAHGLGEPGNYHVMQLVLDFTTANLMNYRNDLSALPPLATYASKPNTELAAMRTGFTTAVHQYLNEINLSTSTGGSPHSIYNIPTWVKPLLTTKHPAATLAPTDLTFQCYPYLASSGDTPDVKLDDNMLLYLEMTKHVKLPGKSLDTSKNWVVPRSMTSFPDGTVALSRKIFIEDWLLVNLEVLNKATWVQATASPIPGEHTAGTWHFSNDADPDVDYSFVDYVDGDGKFYWEFNHGTIDPEENHIVELKPKTNIANRVNVTPGTSQVVITGRSEVDAWFQFKANQKGSKIWATMDWTITITLDTDSTGQLKVTVTAPQPKLTHGRDALPAGGNDIPIWDGTARKYDPRYNVEGKLSEDTLADLEKKLNAMFTSTWPFFFAGNEVFTFSGAVFNNDLDLLLDLSYQ